MGRFIKCALLLVVLSIAVSGMAAAQDKIPIVLGQWVNGEVTNQNYETKYVYSGTAGQLITVVMMADPDQSNLDAALVFRNSDGDILAQNDDVLDSYSLVIVKLPADGDYTILATRYNGLSGDSEGKYWLEVSEAQMITAGTKMTVDIQSEEDKRFPHFYLIQSDAETTMKLGFNVTSGSRYPQIGLFKWINNDYPDILMLAEYMSSVSNMAFSADLNANDYYVLMIDPVPVFYGNDYNSSLTFSIG